MEECLHQCAFRPALPRGCGMLVQHRRVRPPQRRTPPPRIDKQARRLRMTLEPRCRPHHHPAQSWLCHRCLHVERQFCSQSKNAALRVFSLQFFLQQLRMVIEQLPRTTGACETVSRCAPAKPFAWMSAQAVPVSPRCSEVVRSTNAASTTRTASSRQKRPLSSV